MIRVIGITGGIGCGKSAVTDYLEKLNYPIIDTDIIAREVVAPNSIGLKKIIECFGKRFLSSDGTLNRAKLREIIFKDAKQKTQLENILHPLIQQQTKQLIEKFKSQNHHLIFVAIPLLIEITLKKGKPDYIDQIWVVNTSRENQIKRACLRDNSSKDDIIRIINSQATPEQRQKFADQIIDNNHDLSHLYQQLDNLLSSKN